ncbi:hypothetical protein DMENIID0001_058920 [Sergentomyia squamirostris]
MRGLLLIFASVAVFSGVYSATIDRTQEPSVATDEVNGVNNAVDIEVPEPTTGIVQPQVDTTPPGTVQPMFWSLLTGLIPRIIGAIKGGIAAAKG